MSPKVPNLAFCCGVLFPTICFTVLFSAMLCTHSSATTEFSSSVCACVLSHFSHVRLCAVLWTVTRQAPLSMGILRQEYWSGLPCPPPGDLPNPESEPTSVMSPGLAGRFFTMYEFYIYMNPWKFILYFRL